MKRLTISNWSTASKIVLFEYLRGLVIGEATDKSTMYGGAYIYKFYKRGEHVLSITMSRAEAGGKFAVRGQLYDMGRYSKIHNLTPKEIANTVHIRYVFNEIIDELC